jgi:hypothetical protein
MPAATAAVVAAFQALADGKATSVTAIVNIRNKAIAVEILSLLFFVGFFDKSVFLLFNFFLFIYLSETFG